MTQKVNIVLRNKSYNNTKYKQYLIASYVFKSKKALGNEPYTVLCKISHSNIFKHSEVQ